LYLQQVGRVLRPVYAEGFDLSTTEGRLNAIKNGSKPYAVILDHAGNCARHGMPDEIREWSLDDREIRARNASKTGPSVSICSKCFAAFSSLKRACPECGLERDINPRELHEVDGSLEEIKSAPKLRVKYREQGKAQSLDDLIELGRMRGYKNPVAWARYVYNGRLAKK
jgi:superfamily II DNA or RNA helicase